MSFVEDLVEDVRGVIYQTLMALGRHATLVSLGMTCVTVRDAVKSLLRSLYAPVKNSYRITSVVEDGTSLMSAIYREIGSGGYTALLRWWIHERSTSCIVDLRSLFQAAAEYEQFEYDRRVTDWEVARGFERA